MKKLFTKILGSCLGFAMAIGIGVAAINNKDIKAANAVSDTTLTAETYESSAGTSKATLSGTGITWTGSGLAGSSYVVLCSGATLTTNGLTDIDLSEPVTVNVRTRTYGGDSYKTTNIRAYSDSACTSANEITSAAATTDATSKTPAYKGEKTFSFKSTTAGTVYFQATSSTTSASNGPGITGIVLKYTKKATQTTYTVTYDSNGGSGTMTDSNSPYTSGATVTTLENEFTAPTGCVFTGWNTAANGSGTSYAEGATFTINANTTLYAQWLETISDGTTTYVFNSLSWGAKVGTTDKNWKSGANGNSYDSTKNGVQVTTAKDGANATSPAQFLYVKQIVVSYCTNASSGVGTIKVKVGSGAEKSFSVTKASSGGDTLKNATFNYTPRENGQVKLTVNCTSNSLYINSVAITCQENPDKLSTPSPSYNDTTKQVSWSAISNASSYSYKIGSGSWTSNGTSTSYTFATHGSYDFYVKAIGDGTNYSDSDSSDKLTCNVTGYSVTYNGNGKTGGDVPTDNTEYDKNDSVTVSGNTGSLVKANADPSFNYTFGGWTLNAEGTGTVYGPGAGQTSSYTITDNVTFYAKWIDPRTDVTLSASNVEMFVGDDDKTPTITSSPSGHTSGYTLTSSNTDAVTIISNKIHAVAKGVSTITVHIDNDGGYKYTDTTFTVTVHGYMDDNGTGTINFGTTSGYTNINSTSVTGDDSQNNTWTVATDGTTSFTGQSGYAQIGSSSNPAKSITFSATLSKTVKITHFSAKFGGFTDTAGSITLKIGDTTVSTGSLDGTSDFTIGGDITDTEGNGLSVSVTSIAKGVKAYYISYTYITEVHVTGVTLSPDEITLAPNGTYPLTATVAPDNATNKNVTFSSNDTTVATVSSAGVVTAKADGTATITVTTADGSYTDTCEVTVETPEYAYANITATLMGIVDDDDAVLDITYGGTFSGDLDVVTSNSNVEAVLFDNEDGTGTVVVSFENAGTCVISFVDGEDPIENEGSSCTVTVVERLDGIDYHEQCTSNLVFTKTYGTSGATADDGMTWTVTSDAAESVYDDGKGIHYGTGSVAVSYLQLAESSISGTIQQVVVNASGASNTSATLTVTVGSTSFKCGDSESVSLTNTATSYTFTGKASGNITVRSSQDSATIGLYCKSISVTYLASSYTNIANTDVLTQKQVLDFVTTMNTDLAACSTESLTSTIWTNLAGKYATAKAAANDEDLFENMFKYAISTPRDVDGSATIGDSLQNALARYDYILTKYGTNTYNDFLGRTSAGTLDAPATPKSAMFAILNINTNLAPIVVVISMISIAAVGGYYFLRKRKED